MHSDDELSSLAFMLCTQFNKWVRSRVNIINCLLYFYLSLSICTSWAVAEKYHRCTVSVSLFTYNSPPTQSHWGWIMNGSVAWNVQICPINRLSLHFLLSVKFAKGKQTMNQMNVLHKSTASHSPTPHFLFSVHILSIFNFFFVAEDFPGFSFSLLCFFQRDFSANFYLAIFNTFTNFSHCSLILNLW